MLREMRFFSRSISRILTRTSLADLEHVGRVRPTRRWLISVTWTMPSTPPRSTKAPKSVSERTAPVDHAALARPLPGLLRSRAFSSRRTAARDTTSLRIVGVVLEDLERVGLAQVAVEVLGTVVLDLGHRAEAPHAGDGDVEAALAATDHLAFDRLSRGHRLGQLLLEPALEGQAAGHPTSSPTETTITSTGSPVPSSSSSARSQDGLGLAADVHQRDVAVDRCDGPLDHVADLDVLGGQAVAQGFLELVVVGGFFAHGRPRRSRAAAPARSEG